MSDITQNGEELEDALYAASLGHLEPVSRLAQATVAVTLYPGQPTSGSGIDGGVFEITEQCVSGAVTHH